MKPKIKIKIKTQTEIDIENMQKSILKHTNDIWVPPNNLKGKNVINKTWFSIKEYIPPKKQSFTKHTHLRNLKMLNIHPSKLD
jgi:hypothetical protein